MFGTWHLQVLSVSRCTFQYCPSVQETDRESPACWKTTSKRGKNKQDAHEKSRLWCCGSTRSSSFTDSCSKATRGSLVHWYLHFFWGLPVLVIDVVSCAARGGRTGRRLGRISGTGTADGPCASGNASWARPNGRTSSHIPPSHSDTAFLLNTQTHATL